MMNYNPEITSIELRNLCLISGDHYILKDISFSMNEGDAIAILGESGSGKTMLGKILAGQLNYSSGELIWRRPLRKLLISQQPDFRDSLARSYYQQRFDGNYGHESPTVEAELKKLQADAPSPDFETKMLETSQDLQINHLMNRRLIELSNGEGKRLQLAKALLLKPGLLVLDNPFPGLDAHSRKILHEIINSLIRKGITIFLISSAKEIPEEITTVIEIKKGMVKNIQSRKAFVDTQDPKEEKPKPLNFFAAFKDILHPQEYDFNVAIEMNKVTVSYGEKKILENISWKVLKGEHWGLLGQNGSGKSTLLSLINGDNPQAYRNDILLFDKKKGSGESIWEIKSRIGFISPELHIFFQRNLSPTEELVMSSASMDLSAYPVSGVTAFETAASGFNDQIGSSQKISSYQKKLVFSLLEMMGIKELAFEPLYKISLGNQRLVLLVRALVKNPPLLILDEPCQGLDTEQKKRFLSIVDEVCIGSDKTLIYVSHYPEDFPSCVNKFIRLGE